EPKEPKCEQPSSDHDWWKAPFGNRNTSICRQLLVVAFRVPDDVACHNKNAANHPEERQASNTRCYMVDTLENQRVSRQETVQQPVNERHVAGDCQDNGLRDEQSNGTREIL